MRVLRQHLKIYSQTSWPRKVQHKKRDGRDYRRLMNEVNAIAFLHHEWTVLHSPESPSSSTRSSDRRFLDLFSSILPAARKLRIYFSESNFLFRLTSFWISAFAVAVIWSSLLSPVFIPFKTVAHVQHRVFLSSKLFPSFNVATSSVSFAISVRCLFDVFAAVFFTFPTTSKSFFVSFFSFRCSLSCEALKKLISQT